MKIKNIFLLIIITSLSAFLSIYPFPKNIYEFVGGYIALLQPGLVFGIFTGIYFIITRKISLGKFLAWVVCSIVAYTVAIFSSIITIIFGPLLYIVNGAIGAAILATSAKKIIRKFYVSRYIYITGGVAGLIFGIFFNSALNNPNPSTNFQYPRLALIGYLVWQIAVTMALEIELNKNKEEGIK